MHVRKKNLLALEIVNVFMSCLNESAGKEMKGRKKLVFILSNTKSSGHHKNSNKKFAFGKHMFVHSLLCFH